MDARNSRNRMVDETRVDEYIFAFGRRGELCSSVSDSARRALRTFDAEKSQSYL